MRGRKSEIEHRAGWRNLLRRPVDRLFLLKTIVMVAFCVGLLMCPALWIGPRSYPMAPVWSLLPPIEGAVAAGLYGCLFLLAALAVGLPRPAWCIAGFLAIVALFCLADQTMAAVGLPVRISSGDRCADATGRRRAGR